MRKEGPLRTSSNQGADRKGALVTDPKTAQEKKTEEKSARGHEYTLQLRRRYIIYICMNIYTQMENEIERDGEQSVCVCVCNVYIHTNTCIKSTY
jgi:hypothetical protein